MRANGYLERIVQLCQQSPVGKRLPGAFYIHISALNRLPQPLQTWHRDAVECDRRLKSATVLKFSFSRPQISYLFYPTFDTEAHPALSASIQVDLASATACDRSYQAASNPPILHRKETLVACDYPQYQVFADLTRAEMGLGLLERSRFIGTRRPWLQRLADNHVRIEGHRLIPIADAPLIERHRAAIHRTSLSRPVRLALEAELLSQECVFFDYGCGWGGDVERIAHQGITSSGWDPYYRPETPRTEADIVNLGYVINVIEDLQQRREALLEAWQLTRQVLIVAAQVAIDSTEGCLSYGDGIITRNNTFQKYYEQEELKAYIDGVLEVDAVPAALGIYLVFRDEARAQSFRASRFHSRARTPRVLASVRRFEEYQTLLAPLMAFVTQRGRLPVGEELPEIEAIAAELGTLRRAFTLIVKATGRDAWDEIRHQRCQDLLVYLALTHFSHRPKFGELDPAIARDIKALFGTYKRACIRADEMLYSLGDPERIYHLCRQSPVGKQLKRSLLVHVSAIEALDPRLRLYEACASRTIGRLEMATAVKFYLDRPKIAYLVYPDFDTDPHPALANSMQIDLRNLHVSYWEDDGYNPPVLHQKETILTPDYPNYEKFAKLSRQEEDWGLLDDLSKITHRREWLRHLEENCAMLVGSQLRWRQDCDPYKLRARRAATRTRQAQRKRQM